MWLPWYDQCQLCQLQENAGQRLHPGGVDGFLFGGRRTFAVFAKVISWKSKKHHEPETTIGCSRERTSNFETRRGLHPLRTSIGWISPWIPAIRGRRVGHWMSFGNMGGNFGYYYWIISKYEFLLDDQMIQIFISFGWPNNLVSFTTIE